MTKKLLSIFLFCILCLSKVNGLIFEVKDLSKLEEEVCTLDSNSLVLFDVDYTLLTPKEASLKPCGKHLRRQFLHILDPKRREWLQSIIGLEAEEELMDKAFPSLIQRMQKENIPVIGFTAKEKFLLLFLEGLVGIPKRSFLWMIIDQLKSVESAANALGIEFIGFHYIAAETFPCEFDEKLGEFQFRNLVEHERWLSDAEARKVLEQQACDYMRDSIQIIYINGPSSSGKTTLAKSLQQEFDQPFLHIGIDRVIGMMPEKLNNWEGQPAPLGFSWKQSVDETGHPIHEIQTGPFARKMVQTLMEIVLTMAKMGHYVIIDDVSFGKSQVDLWKQALKDYKVLWIGIKSPLGVLETREKERGNRMQGSARAQYFQVHKDVVYDLEFDTGKDSLETIVRTIKERYVGNNKI